MPILHRKWAESDVPVVCQADLQLQVALCCISAMLVGCLLLMLRRHLRVPGRRCCRGKITRAVMEHEVEVSQDKATEARVSMSVMLYSAWHFKVLTRHHSLRRADSVV